MRVVVVVVMVMMVVDLLQLDTLRWVVCIEVVLAMKVVWRMHRPSNLLVTAGKLCGVRSIRGCIGVGADV
jgi:hypothetical protein